MIDKRQILLPSKDVITRGKEDLYINVDLDKAYNEIKAFKYNNVFDIGKMFENERNESRNFFVYGSVDSVFTNCDELELDIYFPVNDIDVQDENAGVSFIRDRSLIELSNGVILQYFDTIVTGKASYGSGNIFGNKKGVYSIALENFNRKYVYVVYSRTNRTILNTNSLFSNGLVGWNNTSSAPESSKWISDKNKRRVFVRNSGVSTSSYNLWPEGTTQFSDIPTIYKFAADVLADTKYPIKVTFNAMFFDGSTQGTIGEVEVFPNSKNETIFVEGNSYPLLASALISTVGLSILFDPRESKESIVYLDRYKISVSENQLDISDKIENNSFHQGLDYWEQTDGISEWNYISTENTIFSRKDTPVGEVGRPRLLSQNFNVKKGIRYILTVGLERSTPPEKMSILFFLGNDDNPKSQLITRPAVDGPLTTPSAVVDFIAEGDYTKLTLEVLIASDRAPNDFIYLNDITIVPRTQLLESEDIVVDEVQTFQSQLVFNDDEGEFIKYGSDSLQISDDGSVDVVENDFPFFYNTHWIKNNIEINRVITRSASLDPEASSLREGESVNINISLNKPSALGVEQATILVESETAVEGVDYEYSPKTIQWNKGETVKTVTLKTKVNPETSPLQQIKISLTNQVRLGFSNNTQTIIDLSDANVSRYTKISIPSVYKNLKSFGQRVSTNNDVQKIDLARKNSIFRNGAEFDGVPEEFYSTDSFTIKITNKGEPVNMDPIPGLTTSPTLLGIGESLEGLISPIFIGTSEVNEYTITVNPNPGGESCAVDIDGHIYLNIDTITDLIEAVQGDNTEKGFSLETISETAVKITASSPGFFISISKFDPSSLMDIQETSAFVYLPQRKLSLNLKANRFNSEKIDYNIELSKPGFKTISVDTGQLDAKENGFDEYFLVTSFSNMRNFLDRSSCISVDGSGVDGNVVFNGALFISDSIGDNGKPLNLTTFGTSINGSSSIFSLTEAVVVECTKQESNDNKLGPYNSIFVE